MAGVWHFFCRRSNLKVVENFVGQFELTIGIRQCSECGADSRSSLLFTLLSESRSLFQSKFVVETFYILLEINVFKLHCFQRPAIKSLRWSRNLMLATNRAAGCTGRRLHGPQDARAAGCTDRRLSVLGLWYKI